VAFLLPISALPLEIFPFSPPAGIAGLFRRRPFFSELLYLSASDGCLDIGIFDLLFLYFTLSYLLSPYFPPPS